VRIGLEAHVKMDVLMWVMIDGDVNSLEVEQMTVYLLVIVMVVVFKLILFK